MWLTSALLLVTACGTSSDAMPQPPHPQNLVATLEDEVRDDGDDRIAWVTYWKLCWDEYPGALRYQLQAMTSEGASPRVRDHVGNCLRLEVARNNNPRELGLHKRDVMLALASGQLAYRIRAVYADGGTSEWSNSVGVGETSSRAVR